MIEHLHNTVHHCDCLDFMRELPDKCIDLVLTDPPYGIDYLSNKTDNHKKIQNDDFDTWVKLIPFWIKEFSRILTDTGVCCCCAGGGKLPVSSVFTLEFIKHFNLIQTVIWDKKTIGLGWKYRPSYEIIVIGSKSKDNYNWFTESKSVSNIVRINNIVPQKGDHPTPKPVELMKYFIKIHTQKNMVVLDPFAGSGTTAIACLHTNRNYILCEKEKEYVDIIYKRIQEYHDGNALIEYAEKKEAVEQNLFNEVDA